MADAVWPLISVIAHLAGQGPAVIQVSFLLWFIFSVSYESLNRVIHECHKGKIILNTKLLK
jgi:hypothetical protein